MIDRDIFEELFVLEMANNHWGSLERGLKIVGTFAQVVRFNNIRAAIKLQFRDVDSFVHKEFRDRTDIRYIKKTVDTRMSEDDFATLVKAIRKASCIPMATPFDEKSVDLCCALGIPIIKIASSDLNDWLLIEKIAKTRKPVIVSTGGSSLKDLDDLVTFFQNRNIPLAINHCVSLYPAEDRELEMNQIDFLRSRYPANTSASPPTNAPTGLPPCSSPTPKAPAPSSATSTSTPAASPCPPTARSPSRPIPGSKPSIKPRRCAARRVPRSVFRRRKKSPISIRWSAASTPNATSPKVTS